MSKTRTRHTANQMVRKLSDANAMLASGKSVGEVLQSPGIGEGTPSRRRNKDL